jgi:hypothetical protein
MRNKITLTGAAVAAMLLSASVAGAQPVIQPNYQPPGAGSGQAFVYQPGPGVATHSLPSGQATQGPITGFGAGGMAHEPGTPPNAPYFRAGAGAGKR